jgi:hypothetical protein
MKTSKMKLETEEAKVPQPDPMDEYEMDANLDTLHKAYYLKKDKKKMALLKKRASEKMESLAEVHEDAEDKITSIKDIRKKANKMAEDEYS